MNDESSDDSPVPPRRSGPEPAVQTADSGPSIHRLALSERLIRLANDPARERVAMGDLLTLMPGQALAALILIFAAPNAVPGPPGLSAVLGLPLIYFSWQLMLGQRPWLPPVVSRRSFTRKDFAAVVLRIAPMLARLERLLRPRLSLFVKGRAEHVVGAICLILSLILALPIPLGNMLPAFAMCLLALGLLERDGLLVVVGTVVAAASMAIVAGVVYAMIRALIFLLTGSVE